LLLLWWWTSSWRRVAVAVVVSHLALAQALAAAARGATENLLDSHLMSELLIP
jgi:hypothetical protein